MTPAPSTPLADLVLAGEGATEAIALRDFVFVSPGVSNSHLVTTDAGSVLINAGLPHEGPRHQRLFAATGAEHVRVIVITQGHLDHIGGVALFHGPDTQLVAQADYPEVRGYWNRLDAFYRARTAVLWGGVTGTAGPPPPDPRPDLLFDDRHAFALGGRRFELLSTPGGETTDSLVVWLPDEGIVFTGNLFGPVFGHVPNLYTIRGDKIRSALRFLSSLERVRELEPELLVTGHGDPIEGAGAIQRELVRLRDGVRHLHDRTVEGMNAGRDVFELMREIRLPPELALGEAHGKVSWVVRAIWEEHAGWFHYDSTASLYPVPASSVHPDLVELAGAQALAERARRHAGEGRPVEALHLSDVVLGVEPSQPTALAARLEALQRLLERSGGENFSEVQWLRGRIEETRRALASPSDP